MAAWMMIVLGGIFLIFVVGLVWLSNSGWASKSQGEHHTEDLEGIHKRAFHTALAGMHKDIAKRPVSSFPAADDVRTVHDSWIRLKDEAHFLDADAYLKAIIEMEELRYEAATRGIDIDAEVDFDTDFDIDTEEKVA